MIEIRGQMPIFFFCLVSKSPTQMCSLSAKNASEKFSRWVTFNYLFLASHNFGDHRSYVDELLGFPRCSQLFIPVTV
jgi:hypothetical protein